MSTPPFKVKAVFEYSSPHDDDLHFPIGQIITVVEEEDEDWYVGEYVDASGDKQEGLFPRNFVEKYEPTAPPRPVRTTRPKKEPEVVPDPTPAPAQIAEPVHEPELEPEEREEAPILRNPPPSAPKAEVPSPSAASKPAESTPPPVTAPKAVPIPKTSAPPPVSDKPAGGSFRDRIAAFNKAAPPPAPFKPGGLGSGGSSNFVKKPFVAPPPSKNYYVPPPREQAPPQKIYRREEDPEIAATELENQEQAERAGLAQQSGEGDEEDQPKPTSLKERIALLQKQQMEQAARHAEAAQKKEKPKRPAKKRTESHDATEEPEGAPLERQNTEDTIGKNSIDSVREETNVPRRRKSSRGASGTPGLHPRKSFGDGNEADMSGAGDTTEEHEEISTGRDDSDEKPRSRAPPPPVQAPTNRAPPRAPSREPDVGEEEGSTEEGDPKNADKEDEDDEEEEEEDIDPEVRRKEELRARMAKMSGGMGMHGMFGPPGGMPMPGSSLPPRKKSSTGTSEKRAKDHGVEDVDTRAPPVPMVPMPGLTKVRSPEEYNRQLEHEDTTHVKDVRAVDEVPDVEEAVPSNNRGAPPPPVPSHESSAPPPIPGGRPAPPPVPKESRPAPPASPVIASPGAGSESDDEMSEQPHIPPLATSLSEAPRPPPRQEAPTSPKSAATERASFTAADATSPTSPHSSAPNKRNSRLPPPIPGAIAPTQTQTRAPPPPPPEASVSRSSTGDERVLPSSKPSHDQESDEEVTEYEGDYDTDIASAAPHKDALKAHARDSSFDDSASARSPVTSPTSAPPPLPPVSAPRAVPPPLPSQPPPLARQSSDMPRAAPPPPPPSKMSAPTEDDDDEYDPYRYSGPRQNAPSFGGPTPRVEKDEEDLYSASPPRENLPPPAQDRAAPPPPPREAPPASSGRAPPRKSMEAHRTGMARRSTDLGRMSMDSGFVANDVDLSPGSFWWTQPNGTPAVFQNRKDILHESEESTASKRGGKTTVTKDLYVLFQDYSQTVITAQFDAQDPKDVKLEQRHEPPPSRLRQDQLEAAHDQFGRAIYEAVTSKKDTVVGDGTPQGLIHELLKPFSNALLPVGTRSYGAVVYANLANASTTQNDEIRPGDIITLRNAKFQGKHGPMHAKYSVDVGKPDHVGVVAEWDGTKKKVRVWEQGRESKKTKMDSFKLDDMRSGEVKIWRVMPRSWVGWEGEN